MINWNAQEMRREDAKARRKTRSRKCEEIKTVPDPVFSRVVCFASSFASSRRRIAFFAVFSSGCSEEIKTVSGTVSISCEGSRKIKTVPDPVFSRLVLFASPFAFSRLGGACLLVFLSGCSYVNVPLNDGTVLLEHRHKNQTLAETFSDIQPTEIRSANAPPSTQPMIYPTPSTALAQAAGISDKDGYFVGLAISGGGSRSANFAAACMFQLERIGILQKVDYISSVSGGSLTAAYYCLNHEGWNPRDVQQKLTHQFATDMLVQTALPWITFALAFTDLDRSDLLAKTLRENLFTENGKEKTFADLQPDRPRLLINATDLQSGRRFVFCNQSFDEINSDLSKYPIAYAVAASSSVPVVLHQVTLRDFTTDYKQYHHLIDGGVCDNLGIQTLVETFRAQEEAAANHHLPDPYPHGAVFIVLDARVDYDQDISSESDTGFIQSLTTAAGLTSGLLLNRASEESLNDVVFKNAPDTATAKEIRDSVDELNRTGYVDLNNVGGHHIRVAHLALTQLQSVTDLPFHTFQESINSTSTYFNIDPSRAALLYTAAELLVRDRFEKQLRGILSEMKSNGQ
jgi:predicted acylesterase/phospholipase RssA